MHHDRLTRREFQTQLAAGAATLATARLLPAADPEPFRLRYLVASCMYGTAPLAEIVPEVPQCGAEHIEIWAEPHGNQREQIDELGVDAVRKLLDDHGVRLGGFTCFKFGILNMQEEMRLIKELGGDLAIANSRGPKDLTGDDLRREVAKFAENLRPHVEFAESVGVTIGVENHSGGLISSPDSIRWLFDQLRSERVGLAMAPYHLPQDPALIANLIRELDSRLVHIQAWEHGMGCMTKLPKEQEMLQLPHRGPLDWKPILGALRDIGYDGRTEIFMHPVPRGIPILTSTAAVTAEINQARRHLDAVAASL